MEPNTHKIRVVGTTRGAGAETTVTVSLAEHPPGIVYNRIADPVVIPVTRPEKEPTVATEVLLLVHTPPAGVPDNVIVLETHIVVRLVMDGLAFTVTVVVAEHPEGSVYVAVAIPALTPVTIPEADPIVATASGLMLHVPPAGVDDKVVEEPAQIVVIPVMALAPGFTVIDAVI
jgi:hypothetical protein